MTETRAPYTLSDHINNQQGQTFRMASKGTYFPYSDRTIPFIMIAANKSVTTAQTTKQKLQMLYGCGIGSIILAVWPGQWTSDVFQIDDLDEAKDVLMGSAR